MLKKPPLFNLLFLVFLMVGATTHNYMNIESSNELLI